MGREIHDHDRGLRFDLTVLSRRRALAVLGGSALGVVVGCGSDDDTSNRATTTSSTSSSGTTGRSGTASSTPAGTGDCATIPEETAGPYPGDGSNGPNVLDKERIVRSDIRSSFGSSSTTAEGVPLAIKVSLVDSAAGCEALAGAAVYVWHCDRSGGYSLYSDGVQGENYLRGVQAAGDDGTVTFSSIFPAVYAGRWPHIHFEVYKSLADATSAGTPTATSQIALPEDVCNEVYATSGYEASVSNLQQITLATDGVFGDDGGASQLGTASGSVEKGFTVALTVPVGAKGV